ncbi:MAG: hypothetical protein ACYTFG_20315 [Planctomycetota bacterium]
MAYIRSQGLSPDASNVTVTSFGRHPKVKGNGYVPYYMIFDHHGDLVYDHMCGSYHGGDGLKCIEKVEELLLHAPAIYLGRKPFEVVPKLAEKIASGKGFASTVKSVETRLQSGEESEAATAELKRLMKGVIRHRDKGLREAEVVLATRPSSVVKQLARLEKELKGTALAAPVSDRLAELKGSKGLRTATEMEKKFVKIRKSLERLAPCKDCKRKRIKSMSPACPTCRSQYGPVLAKLKQQLTGLADTNPDLPISKTIREFAQGLG